MNKILTLLLSLSLSFTASAQSVSLPGKIAVVSLIGNVITVDTYRRRTGTAVDSNYQEVLPIPTPVFDNIAISEAASAIYPHLTPGSSVSTLAVPAPDSGFDPSRLVIDGAVSGSNPLVVALRENGFTHLLAIAKHRGIAKFELVGATVGSGQVQGLGFYVDTELPTKRSDTRESGRGFIAPYAYIRIFLIDLKSLEILGDRTITAATARSAARNESGLAPWDAVTPEEKVSMLEALLRKHVSEAVPLLFQRR